ncbi:hypothetical protein MUN78_11465 [Leucobacter allii]|uniref:Uncharacterized protein n=1 Tax=Leucobacter allii TaxID=2932247 RepID=A0ABY4FHZ3_9MICO|nr:hypothetical protein [Leucobacter allii]UOQ56301.1 hypothetical protein MUN78_11465 [Leucobacter allii]
MNTTSPAPRPATADRVVGHPPEPEHLALRVPNGAALRRLSVSERMRLRVALWLLLRTPAGAEARSQTARPAGLAPIETGEASAQERRAARRLAQHGRASFAAEQALRHRAL